MDGENTAPRDPGMPLLASLDSRIESLLVAAQRPVAPAEIAALLPEGSDVASAIERIAAFWAGRGVQLVRGPEGLSLKARKECLPPDNEANARRLSEGAIATLAVIAMHQPLTVPQIEAVRRVKLARGIIESLEASGLIEEVDRRRGTGRAKLYGTTEGFLRMTGLEALSDMPTPEEVLHTEIVQA